MARRLAGRLLKPYIGSPPPGLYRPHRPDLLIRLAGTALPHFVSVVMRLGGDQELPDLPQAVNRRPMRIAGRRTVAREVVELTLAPPDGARLPAWHAGAHIDVHLPSGRKRQYSLCGNPDRDDEYRIAVRQIAGGRGGSVEIHGLSVGQCLDISEPRNAFMMPVPGSGSRADKIHFVVGGIGITPILPMIRVAERSGVPWSLCYAGRSRDTMPFLDELAATSGRVQLHPDDELGPPTAANLLDGLDGQTALYVCGPPPMIDAVLSALPPDLRIEVHIERFSPAPVVNGKPFQLELARAAETVDVGADETALAALLSARPNAGYSCMQGFCGSCVQRVVSGDVDHRDSLLTQRQRDLGQMLPCVSRAATAGGKLVLDL